MKETRADHEEPTIKERVVVYLRRREGDHVTTGDVAGALAIRRDQATSALHNLAKHAMRDSVTRVGDGVWTYSSPTQMQAAAASADAGTWKPVGRLPSGAVLLVDGAGRVWEANEIDYDIEV